MTIHYCDIKDIFLYWHFGPFAIKLKAEREPDTANYYQAIFIDCRRTKWSLDWWALRFSRVHIFYDHELYISFLRG